MKTHNLDETAFREIIARVHVALPVRKFTPRFMKMIEEYRVNIEIGLDHYNLDAYSTEHFRELGASLRGLGISMTVHAPFHELFLGSPDRLVRNAAIARMDRAFELIPFFNPRTVVVHLNYEKRRFGFVYEEWKPLALSALSAYAERAAEMGTAVMLENVYEETPEVMEEVLGELSGAGIYHCCDVGHVHAFSDCTLASWLEANGKHVRQFHLHDNDGTGDTHSPIGSGTVDFELVKKCIAGMKDDPVITLEPHCEEHLWASLEGFHRAGILEILKSRNHISGEGNGG